MEVSGQVLAYQQRFDSLQSNRSANSGDRDDWEKMFVVAAFMRWFRRKPEESGDHEQKATFSASRNGRTVASCHLPYRLGNRLSERWRLEHFGVGSE